MNSQVRSLHHRTSMLSSSSSRVVSDAARDWEGPVGPGWGVQLAVEETSTECQEEAADSGKWDSGVD